MTARLALAMEDRLKIAELIAQMNDPVLRIEDNKPSGYFSLKVGTGPNSNVVTVRKNKDQVSFFISSTGLLNKARAAGFDPQAAEPNRPCDKDKYRFRNLSFADLQNNEGLFREIVKNSVETIVARRPKRNSR